MAAAHTLVWDVETRSTVDLTEVGMHVYARHPSTEVLCLAWAVDGGVVKVWRPDMAVPKDFIKAHNEKWTIVAHNLPFEDCILRYILTPRHGFPKLTLDHGVCTMSLCAALALPGSLGQAAKVLELENQKDATGNLVMLQTMKPRNPKKDEDPNVLHWYEDEERMARLAAYCMQDVEAERELYHTLPPLSKDERLVWEFDQRVNERGVYVDREFCLAADKIVREAQPKINARIAMATGGAVQKFTEVAKLKKWLTQHVPQIDTLGKADVAKFLKDPSIDPAAKEAMRCRVLGAQAAANKPKAFLMRLGPDSRVRDEFTYHAAGTGRWSSRGVQVHNLKRNPYEDEKKTNEAIDCILKGSFEGMLKAGYENPLGTIGDCIRGALCATPGHTLIGADFSGIEARVTAWLAGETSKLEVFRKFDAKEGPDPYVIAASKIFGVPPKEITKEQRQVGKACELAFGYQGGVGAYRKFQPATQGGTGTTEHGPDAGQNSWGDLDLKSGFTDVEIERIKLKWRAAHPNIVALWSDLD